MRGRPTGCPLLFWGEQHGGKENKPMHALRVAHVWQ
nr:MAG TPA: hypothetical protein [Caudoviricetes sp.]